MLRYLLGLCLLSSCSLGVVKTGGEKSYVYDVQTEYSQEDLKELSSQIVTTLQRDPQKGKLEELFSKDMKPVKRYGILVFETIIQETRGGLAGEDKIYLSAQGKQLLTEKLLSLWEQSLPILDDQLEFVSTAKIKKSKSFQQDGMDVTDFINAKREALAPDDIFYRAKGKETTVDTVMNPRGMRDLSLALVPASELMSGPKFSEHAKHTVNEVAKELKLDAVLVVMSKINWTASRIDKHSGEIIPEQFTVSIDASVLIPMSDYHQRLEKLGESRVLPKTTVAYRSYESELKVPVQISVPDHLQNFNYIEKELLTPMMKTYNDLSHMVHIRMVEDLKKTF